MNKNSFTSSMKVLVVLSFCLGLASCSKGTQVSSSLSLGELQQKKTGVAVLKMSIESTGCTGKETYFIAKKRRDRAYPYIQVMHVITPRDVNSVAQFELKPGTYHVVDYLCVINLSNGYRKISLQVNSTREHKRYGVGSNVYKKSIASFTVKPGEIVNAGYLKIRRTSYKQGVSEVGILASDLPKASYAWLKENKPNLHKKMVKRLMKLARRR